MLAGSGTPFKIRLISIPAGFLRIATGSDSALHTSEKPSFS